MFESHNEDNVLKAQTKENLELSKYQVNVPLKHHDVIIFST